MSKITKVLKFLGMQQENPHDMEETPKSTEETPKSFAGWTHVNSFSHSYTGEKNLGEMGPIRDYRCDYDALRMRSWQMILESEICSTVFQKLNKWIIGSGLKLQSEPQEVVLKSEKISIDTEEFNSIVESRFQLYANSTMSSYSGMCSLNKLSGEAHLNAIVGGDVLVVLRLIDGVVKVQLIDGAHIRSPYNFTFNGFDFVSPEGNVVRYGVEIKATGEHVAYYVHTGLLQYERIPARGKKSGVLMAWLQYGLKYRLDSIRGIPLISAVMETAKKMERYKEAVIGSAEERAKIPFSIEHSAASTGENPMAADMAKVVGVSSNIPVTVDGEILANKVAASTNKEVFNMPIGAVLKSLESTNELHFGEFYDKNIMLVCATVGIPKSVAMSAYEDNYSSSRAAIKDFEHTIMVNRKDFSDQFHKNVYAFWLNIEVLSNKVDAPGYLEALFKNNLIAVEAYRNARWAGANVPHIDPLKEVQAEREKLGSLADHIPLTTVEAATESLNGGEYSNNVKQFAKEVGDADELGLKSPEPDKGNPPKTKTKSEEF